MRNFRYGFVFFLLFTGCNPEVKNDVPAVQSIVSPVGNNSSLPFLFSNKNRTLLSWVEKVGDSVTELKYAELINREWKNQEGILKGSDWFVNWADFPAMAENNGNLISHVLKKSSEGTYSYDIKLNLRPKGEPLWKTNLPLHTDGTPTEHGFVTTLPYKDGFFMTWLDGRNTMEDENEQRGAMTIRSAMVSPTGEISNEIELDNRVCDCCQTTATVTANGPIVIYRDRSEDEIRDMSIVRWENDSWTEPKTVYSDNWQIKGCPVNGPKATSLRNTLAMAWFTAANKKPSVKLIFSEDNGVTFDMPIIIAENEVIGRVDVLLLNENEAIVSWMELGDSKAFFKSLKVNRDGSLGQQLIISDMDASRQSGFPQMELVNNTVHFAWTEVGDSTSQVRTAFVQVDRF